jgi:uncharacterized protein YceH (UPF0502 family)
MATYLAEVRKQTIGVDVRVEVLWEFSTVVVVVCTTAYFAEQIAGVDETAVAGGSGAGEWRQLHLLAGAVDKAGNRLDRRSVRASTRRRILRE